MDSPVVLTQGLRKIYNPDTPFAVEVLHGVDLTVNPGEFVAVIGQSGSGKSTLLNLLGALDKPTAGTVQIDGHRIEDLDSDELASLRNKSIGFVFQFHHLLDEFTCLENAMMPILVRKGEPEPDEIDYTKSLLDRVGLADQMRKRPSEMSGGQQQRVAIIRALAAKPRLVLADEPTGNLDSVSGKEVFSLMGEMTRESGVAFIMVTHDERLANAADRIIRIEDGLIQEIPKGHAA